MLALLLAGMVVVTFALTLTTRVSAADGHDAVAAQLAAESGLAHARAHLADLRRVLDTVRISDEDAAPRLDALVSRFCGEHPWRDTADGARCNASEQASDGALDVFTALAPATAYPDGEDAAAFWRDVLFGRERDVVLDADSSLVRHARWNVVLRPSAAERTSDATYRLHLRLVTLEGVGTVERDGQVVARRHVRVDTTDDLVVTIARRSLHRFAVLRDAPSTTNEANSFRAGDHFVGPVHSNAAPVFEMTPTAFARFDGTFSTASSSANVTGDVGCASLLACPKMFASTPTFDAPTVVFPTPGDVLNDVTTASSTSGARLSESGLTIEGNVDRLVLSVRDGRQIVDVTQGGGTTSLRAREDGLWDVWRGENFAESGVAFSGVVLVRGDVRDMRGDGSNAPDVSNSARISIVALGGIGVGDDVTFSQDPRVTPSAINSLGLVALGGDLSILPSRSSDLSLHANVAVLADGRGLATPSCASIAACPAVAAPTLHLLGSVAERAPRPLAVRLDVIHDDRTPPPAFPREARWTVDTSTFAVPGTWRQVP